MALTNQYYTDDTSFTILTGTTIFDDDQTTTEADLTVTSFAPDVTTWIHVSDNKEQASKTLAVQFAVGIYILLLNTTLIFLIKKCSQLSKTVKIFLIHLCFCELALVPGALFRVLLSTGTFTGPLCIFILLTGVTSDAVGQVTMCLFAIKYFLTTKNLHINYRQRLTFKHFIAIFAATWIILSTLSYIGVNSQDGISVGIDCYLLNGIMRLVFS